MADISKLKTIDGTTYGLKDAAAYRKGAAARHRNSSISQDPQYVTLIENKTTLEQMQGIRALAGIGDYFYALHLNPDYTITCNYYGKNGTKGNYYNSTLFSPSASSTVLLDVDAIAETPFVLEIQKKVGNITATDVVHLETYTHTLGNTVARLTDYKVELHTTGSTAASGEHSWQTVYERHNVSDSLSGLVIALNPTSYSYLYFDGVRFTIYGATPGSTSPTSWNYNCVDLSLFRLVDQRPAFSAARAIGALDIAGGSVYGMLYCHGGISGNGSSLTALNGSNVSSGTVAADRIAALAASKITSGTFDTARIPNLDASKITSGTLGADRIPALSAAKITSGTFDAARIPSLNASKITDGTLSAERIPTLDAEKIGTGTLSANRLPESGVTAGSYGQATNTSPAFGGTFNVPYATVDEKGRVTAASTKTVTLPAYSTATSSANGLMSATDKSKLDNLTTIQLSSGISMTEGTDGLIFTYTT